MKYFKKRKRVLVAMSGGVDSSVAAAILLDQGYDVVGVTLQVWDYSRTQASQGCGTCCSSVDVEDARAVCQHLGIPFYVLNCEDKFQKKVIDRFVDSYLNGETPIPCVDCNTYLKFDYMFQKMHKLDCDYLATGHYAQKKQNKNGKWHIYQSSDDWKDQTYFLFTINPKVIPYLLFPIGDKQKPEVRTIAKQKGLLNVFRKKDSTGLCFVGSGGYASFIRDQLNTTTSAIDNAQSSIKSHLKPVKNISGGKKGVIKKYPSGEVLGTHPGLYHFTYGQRKGLGVNSNKALFVVKIDAQSNTLWLGEESDLYSKQAIVKECNWLDKVTEGERLKVKIRFHHTGCWTRVYKDDNYKYSTESSDAQNYYRLQFEQAQKAVTPGQVAVLYRQNQLVGGGRIVC